MHIKDPKTGGDLYVMRTLKVSDMQQHVQGRKGVNQYNKAMGTDDELLTMNIEILNDARDYNCVGLLMFLGAELSRPVGGDQNQFHM